jgi:hypothetical protein
MSSSRSFNLISLQLQNFSTDLSLNPTPYLLTTMSEIALPLSFQDGAKERDAM